MDRLRAVIIDDTKPLRKKFYTVQTENSVLFEFEKRIRGWGGWGVGGWGGKHLCKRVALESTKAGFSHLLFA